MPTASLRTPAAWVSPPSDRRIAVALIGVGDPWATRVRAILARDGIVATVVGAGSLDAALEASVAPLDVVLVWLHGDGGHAEHQVRSVRRRLSAAGIVVVITAGDDRAMRGLVAAGADALVAESDLPGQLGVVVRAACAGLIAVPRGLRHLIEPAALSARERQVLGLAIAGHTNGEIARRLCLGESTVKTHMSSAFRRLGVRSRREAAAIVLDRDALLGC